MTEDKTVQLIICEVKNGNLQGLCLVSIVSKQEANESYVSPMG